MTASAYEIAAAAAVGGPTGIGSTRTIDGVVTTIAGGRPGFVDGPASNCDDRNDKPTAPHPPIDC